MRLTWPIPVLLVTVMVCGWSAWMNGLLDDKAVLGVGGVVIAGLVVTLVQERLWVMRQNRRGFPVEMKDEP